MVYLMFVRLAGWMALLAHTARSWPGSSTRGESRTLAWARRPQATALVAVPVWAALLVA